MTDETKTEAKPKMLSEEELQRIYASWNPGDGRRLFSHVDAISAESAAKEKELAELREKLATAATLDVDGVTFFPTPGNARNVMAHIDAIMDELATADEKIRELTLTAKGEAAAHDRAKQELATVKDERDRARDMLRQSEASGEAVRQALNCAIQCPAKRDLLDRAVEHLRQAKELFVQASTNDDSYFEQAAQCRDLDHCAKERRKAPVGEMRLAIHRIARSVKGDVPGYLANAIERARCLANSQDAGDALLAERKADKAELERLRGLLENHGTAKVDRKETDR